MSVLEIHGGNDRRSMIKRYERKSKADAIRELVDLMHCNWRQVELLEKARDAALAELTALKVGREAVATKWGHGVQGVPPYGFTCHADRRDQWLAEGKEVYVMDTAPPAQASAWVPEGYTAVLTETLEWMLGERGEFVCPPSEYFRGNPTPHFWRKHLRASMLAAAPTPGASDGKGDVVTDGN